MVIRLVVFSRTRNSTPTQQKKMKTEKGKCDLKRGSSKKWCVCKRVYLASYIVVD